MARAAAYRAAVPGGDALGAVGYPVPAPPETRGGPLGSSIDLTGGGWGDGSLVRDADSSE